MDALWEWMESDLGVIMVGTWRLCERTETATTKRRMTRKNAIKTAFPAENALNNSKTSSFGPEKEQNRNAGQIRKKATTDTKAENTCSKTRGKRMLQTKTSQQQHPKNNHQLPFRIVFFMGPNPHPLRRRVRVRQPQKKSTTHRVP